MKALSLLYNPQSGDKSMPARLDSIIERLQLGDYLVQPYRLPNIEAVDDYLRELPGKTDALAVCGGDGTINHVVNAMKKHGIDLPLGLIPSGTANDFASFLGIPSDPADAAAVIARGDILKIDLGVVNGNYFINVCAAGVLASVSQSIDLDFKNNFGKLAYYLKGIEQIKNLEPLRMRITTSTSSTEEELYLFLVLNSSGTAGFRDLTKNASVVDGKLDFIGIKAKPLGDIAVLFMKMLAQPKDYLTDSNVIYFQDKYFEIDPLFDDARFFYTDVDGEKGPNLPIKIEVEPSSLKVFI